jgi:hypothetical protein
VAEAARVLKPGGVLLVQGHLVPEAAPIARYTEAVEKLRGPSHDRAFTEGEWRAMFTAAGLAVTHTEPFVKTLNYDAWADRQGVTPHTKACLDALVALAPPAVRDWMSPQRWGTPAATYSCHHARIGLFGARASSSACAQRISIRHYVTAHNEGFELRQPRPPSSMRARRPRSQEKPFVD